MKKTSTTTIGYLILLVTFTLTISFTKIVYAGATAKEAEDIVKKAVDYIKANGKEKALKEFNDPKGSFVKGDLYVFAFDFKTVCIAHGVNQKLVGKDLTDLKDSDGKQFMKQMTELAAKNGSGWIDYNWTNPETKKIQPKSSFYMKIDNDYYIGAGIYK